MIFLLIAVSSTLCYGASNDDFAESLSNYENRINEIYQQLDYAYWNTYIEKDTMALILKVKKALYKLKSDMNEDQVMLFEKDRKKRDDSGETDIMANKLKTLNKLFANEIITKDDFEEQKKRLLDNYTEKTN